MGVAATGTRADTVVPVSADWFGFGRVGLGGFPGCGEGVFETIVFVELFGVDITFIEQVAVALAEREMCFRASY